MKLLVQKNAFLKNWNMAERSASSAGASSILSTVRIKANHENVELFATDIKTSLVCKTQGITVQEPGEVVLPIKMVGDIFKKIESDEFSLVVKEGKATVMAGKSRYKFTVYPVEEFPRFPSSEGARKFCTIKAQDFSSALVEGTLAASVTEEFPQYLSSAYFQMDAECMRVVTTDTRRLALCKVAVTEGLAGESIILPMKGLREFEKVLATLLPDSDVHFLHDDSQAYFVCEGVEFSIRKVESRFPPYEKIIPQGQTTWMIIDRQQLLAALERIDIVVRDFNRLVLFQLSPGGECTLRGRAPEMGNAVEELSAEIDGEPVKVAVNSRFFLDGLRVLKDPSVRICFNGTEGHVLIKKKDTEDYLCLVAPIAMSEEELRSSEEYDAIAESEETFGGSEEVAP